MSNELKMFHENLNVFHKGKYYISFKRGVEDVKKDIVISIDKIFEKDCLRITLSDDEDPTFLCLLNVTRLDYEDLKKQQGLLIDFDNFPSQLVRLLQQCASNNMFLILHQGNCLDYNLEIVEHNEFKRLIHLSLKASAASDHSIKCHMADTIRNLKNTVAQLKSKNSLSETTWNEKCLSMERKIHDLSIVVAKLEEDKLRRETEYQELLKKERDRLLQERAEMQRTNEMTCKSQVQNLQETISRKDRHIEEITTRLRHTQDNVNSLESQLSEKINRMKVLEQEVQSTHIELATNKAKMTVIERELCEKDKTLQIINTRIQDLEKEINEKSKKYKEALSNINLLKSEKVELEERLAVSESLTNKNNQAVQNTSEQIMKANQIIAKLNADLVEVKEKMLCRTAIALEQEKVIDRNNNELEALRSTKLELTENLEKMKSELEQLKTQCTNHEKIIKEKDETIQNNNEVIQWLHKKFEDDNPHQINRHEGFTNSTPYLTDKNYSNEDSYRNDLTDDIPNFYAISKSKLTLNEDTPQTVSSKAKGLDPKYLRPLDDGRSRKTGSSNTTGKDKENKRTNLPKVDYKDKKSSRTISYKSTPVSAYFPHRS